MNPILLDLGFFQLRYYGLQDLALMLYPFIPSLATKILDNLNLTNSLNAGWKNVGNWEKLKSHTIKEGKILLSKLENEQIQKLKKEYGNF